MKRPFSFSLFALVACAHAFVAGLAAVAVRAGFHLDAAQAAVILISAVIIAAFNAAADILVGFLIHGDSPRLRNYLSAKFILSMFGEIMPLYGKWNEIPQRPT